VIPDLQEPKDIENAIVESSMQKVGMIEIGALFSILNSVKTGILNVIEEDKRINIGDILEIERAYDNVTATKEISQKGKDKK
jgi:hypothetical protein